MSNYPDTPITREEQYLAAGLDGGDLPDPITREEQYLYEIATKMQEGGGPSVTVEPLTVTENGTTTAPSGKAYNPVITDVPSPNYVETISGTFSNPWGANTPSDLFTAARNGNLTMYIEASVTYSEGGTEETATMMFFPISGVPTFGFTKPGSSASTLFFARTGYANTGNLGRAVAGNINVTLGTQELIGLSGDTPCTLTIIHHPLPDSE